MPQAQLDLFEGTRGELVDRLREIARGLSDFREEITIDDVRDTYESMPGSIPIKDNRVMGTVFAEKDVWQHVGFKKTNRKSSHGRPISVWKRK